MNECKYWISPKYLERDMIQTLRESFTRWEILVFENFFEQGAYKLVIQELENMTKYRKKVQEFSASKECKNEYERYEFSLYESKFLAYFERFLFSSEFINYLSEMIQPQSPLYWIYSHDWERSTQREKWLCCMDILSLWDFEWQSISRHPNSTVCLSLDLLSDVYYSLWLWWDLIIWKKDDTWIIPVKQIAPQTNTCILIPNTQKNIMYRFSDSTELYHRRMVHLEY